MTPHIHHAGYRTALAVFLALPVVAMLATQYTGANQSGTRAGFGRQVYIAEGCVHCHSQYIRPGTLDEERWGAARNPEFSRHQLPALIGNRRQGPDLMTAGVRLPRDWHRRHLIEPRSVSPESRMPSYAYLFADGDARGEALLDYLQTLGNDATTGDEERVSSHATQRTESVVATDPKGRQAANGTGRS